MPDEVLIEALDFSSAAVDEKAAVIRGVKLSGRLSRNKRKGRTLRYSDEAIQQSVKAFDGCPVTVRGGHDRSSRDYLAQNGQLRNGVAEGLGTDAACSRFEWHLNPNDPTTPKILYDAQHFPNNLPLSQEVMEWTEAMTEEGDILVTSITDNPLKVGVAAVYRGGLNNSLFESLEHDMEIKTKEELQAHFPALCEELSECACAAARNEVDTIKSQLADAVAAREAASSRVEELEAELAKYKMEELRIQRVEEIKTAAAEICGEGYKLKDELLENLLALYDDERYKKTLTEIASWVKANESKPVVEEAAEEEEEPTSTSGTSYSRNGKPRRRVGLHNRII